MSKKPLIIYGTGNRAADALDIVREKFPDHAAVAYCSKTKEKVGRIIRGLPVLSREDVKRSYPDGFFIYISPSPPVLYDIAKELIDIGFVTKEQILNQLDRKKYFSCGSLENVALVENRGIFYCCSLENIRNAAPFVPWQNTMEETVDLFLKQRDRFIEELQTRGADNPCAGCPDLRGTYWETDRHVSILALSMAYPCHLACSYCDLPTNAKHLPEHRDQVEKACSVSIPELLKCLREKGHFSPSEPIQISGGEITASPVKGELLAAVSPYPVQVFTTAVIYDETIAALTAREDGSFLNVSLDSGTAETYRRVKGLDAFERVKATLRRYRAGGSNLLLKYILLPENTARVDLDSFLELAAELKPQSVSISCDIRVKTSLLPQAVIDGAVYLALGCQRRGLAYTILPYFGNEHLREIQIAIEKTAEEEKQ